MFHLDGGFSMKRRMIFLVPLVVLLGCATVNYIGDSYPPTQHVDVFFSEKDVEKEYRVMGRVEATANADELIYSGEKFMQTICKKAEEKGADGVVILDFGNVMTGTSESRNRTETSENRENRTITHEHEDISHSVDEKRRVEALVIKYKN
jgi:hypothetical protein